VNGWNKTPVTVTLTATDDPDGCGVVEIHYCVDGGPEAVILGGSATVEVATEGVTSITFFAVDAAGNAAAPSTHVVRIDRTPPTVVIAPPADGIVFLLHQAVTVD
jgi:hypothetical protein